MATLFALLYPDQQSRKAALESVHGLEDAGYLHVLESAQVTKTPTATLNTRAPIARCAPAPPRDSPLAP